MLSRVIFGFRVLVFSVWEFGGLEFGIVQALRFGAQFCFDVWGSGFGALGSG